MRKKRPSKRYKKASPRRNQRDSYSYSQNAAYKKKQDTKQKAPRGDRRAYKEEDDAYYKESRRRPFSYQLGDPFGINKLKGRLTYAGIAKLGLEKPNKALICAKRKIRRLTLFKLRSIGSGIAVTKRRINNKYSNINCKRR